MLPIQKDALSGVALGSIECSVDGERIVSGAVRKMVPEIRRKKECHCGQQLLFCGVYRSG